ncbi:MAG: hypothetical protein RLY61_147 [Candidatus Parcubacteria bacterium]
MSTNTPLTIAFDARFFNEAGPGRYVKNLLSHLEQLDTLNTYYVLLKANSYDDYKPTKPNFIKVKADYTWYSFKEQTFFLLKLITLKPDILYVPHFNIPIFYPKVLITAIPDIIMHTFSTEKGTTLPKSYFKFKKLVYKLVTKWAVFRSSYILVPSHATEHDITTVFGPQVAKKVILAPEGIDPDINTLNTCKDYMSLLTKLKITQTYILYVGSMYEHKNLLRLIDAYEIASKQGLNHVLVLAGKADKFSKRIADYVADKHLTSKILIPGQQGRLTDQEMNTLRQHCEYYVFPSLKEGFSLTPLECMVFDKPCVLSAIPCHKEIYGDSVIYFNPFEINDIVEKMLKLDIDTDLKVALITKGKELLKHYSWHQTAQLTLATFNKFLKNS